MKEQRWVSSCSKDELVESKAVWKGNSVGPAVTGADGPWWACLLALG